MSAANMMRSRYSRIMCGQSPTNVASLDSRHASDWIRSRMQKAGINVLSRKTAGMPPTESGPSKIAQAFRTEGQDQ